MPEIDPRRKKENYSKNVIFLSRITVRHTLEVKATKVLQNSSDNIQLPGRM